MFCKIVRDSDSCTHKYLEKEFISFALYLNKFALRVSGIEIHTLILQVICLPQTGRNI